MIKCNSTMYNPLGTETYTGNTRLELGNPAGVNVELHPHFKGKKGLHMLSKINYSMLIKEIRPTRER